MNLIENKNFLTDKELEELNELRMNDFPWYYGSSGDYETDKSYFSHTIIARYDPETGSPEINSRKYAFFEHIFDRFCRENKIDYKRILRMNLNFTSHFDSEFFGQPHADHDIPHQTMVMYLYGNSGNTVLFDGKYTPNSGELTYTKENLKVAKEVEPEVGKVISFDGMTFHTIRPPKINTSRIICVLTYELK